MVVEQKPVVKAPRALWLEFIFHMSTFGIYSCLWLVFRTREINQITKDRYFTPWLWFFVPFIAIVQLFALPKFIKKLNELGEKFDVAPWKGWYGAWTALVFLLTVFFNITSRVELPNWLEILGLVIWSLLFVRLQVHINNVKHNLKHVTFYGSAHSLSKWEWGTLVPITLRTLPFLAYSGAAPLFSNSIKPLAAGSDYVSENRLYQLPIVGEGWTQVKVGTFSDGSAEMEIQGALNDMYFLLFNHGLESSLNSVSQWRVMELKAEHSNLECKEHREFSKYKLSVVSRIVCNGSLLGEPIIQTISLIETEKGIFELIGRMSSAKVSFAQRVNDINTMAEGFEPL